MCRRGREAQQQQQRQQQQSHHAVHAGAPGRRTPLPPRVTRDDSWSRRMREQYGVDTSMLSYDPQTQQGAAAGAVRGGAAEGPTDRAAQGRCVIS